MDFLFENPFLIVILIGIISSFFKKPKNEPNPNQKQPKPFMESIPKRISEVLEEFDLTEDESEKSIQTDYLESKRQAEAKITQLEEQKAKYMQKVVELETEKKRNNDHSVQPENEVETSHSSNLNKDKLADAIIWAEILGPPRAKKPHRSMNIR